MNTNPANILHIADLPEQQRWLFQRVQAVTEEGDHLTGRLLLTTLVSYYIEHNRDIPQEILDAHHRLLALKNPPPIAETEMDEPAEADTLSPFDEQILKGIAEGILKDAEGQPPLLTILFAQHWACGMLGMPTIKTLTELEALLTDPAKRKAPHLFMNPHKLGRKFLLQILQTHGYKGPLFVPTENLPD